MVEKLLHRPYRPLGKTLIVYIVLFSSIITFGTTGFQLYREYSQSLDVIDANFRQMETSSLPSITSAVWTIDLNQLEILLDGVLARPDIVYVEVREKGQLLASSGAQIHSNFTRQKFNLIINRAGEQIDIGQLVVDADLTEVYGRLFDHIGVILLSNGIKTFLVALFIFSIFGYLVTRHINTMAAYVRHMPPVESAEPLKLNRSISTSRKPNELDDLVSAINEMRENIQEFNQSLRESETRFRDIAEVSGDWIWEMDANLRFTYLSDRAVNLTGGSATASIGKTRMEALGNPEITDAWRAHLDDLENHHTFRDFEYSIRAENGQIRFVKISGKSIFDKNGTFKGYRGTGTDITEFKRIENEKAEQTALMRTILDTVPTPISLRDAEGRFVFWNKQLALEMEGTPEEYMGKTATEVHGAVPGDSIQTLALEVLETKEPILERELQLARRGGRIHRYSIVPVFDDNGDLSGVLALGRDVTVERESQDAVRQSDALLRSIIDNSPTTVSLKDLDGRFQLVNKAYSKVFGVTEEQALGGRGNENLFEPHLESRDSHEVEVIEKGEAVTQERIGELPSGQSYHRLITKFPIRNQSGAMIGIGSIGADLTELRKVEQSLHMLEARLSDILRIAPEVIISTNAHGNILLFNNAAETTFGYERDEVIGQPLDILLPDHVRSNHGAYLKSFIDSPDTVRLMGGRGEISGRRSDGSIFPADASISKLKSGDETILTVTLHDITERQKSEEGLRVALIEATQANQAKSEFLATMSHELRTPLNAIIGFSEMLSGQYFGALGSGKYVEYASDIKNSGEHLLQLINDLLDLSTIEAGERHLTKEIFNFWDIAEDCVPIVAEGANRKQLTFTNDVPDNLPSIYADRRAIKQILINVLSNATKFTPESGEISLSATALDNRLVIKVRDTGLGIPKDKIGSLTDPFMRGEPDPHKAQDGAGLGLAIVKSLVDIHGGELEIKSESGKGTSVTISLPFGDV
jgi:PAS domain S-box-containing protein